MGEFINLTNHPSAGWSEKQLRAAQAYGTVVDLPFPRVSPAWTDGEIDRVAGEYLDLILRRGNPVVLLQGDFLFTYRLIRLLKKADIRVVTACCERKAAETVCPDGTVRKSSVFEFDSFKEY